MSPKKFRYSLIALVIAVSLSSVFSNDKPAIAQALRPQRATFVDYDGAIGIYPNGRTPIRTPDTYTELKSDNHNRDHLWVAGDLRSWASLQFWHQSRKIGPLVKAGVDRTDTRYIFPCEIQLGNGIFAWGLGPVGTSVCEGVTISLDESDLTVSNTYSQEIASAKLACGKVKVNRLEEKTLIHTYRRDSDIAVDVLVGAVQIIGLDGTPFNAYAGKRYVRSAESENFERVDLSEAAESPSVKDFFNETDWSLEEESLLENLESQLLNLVSMSAKTIQPEFAIETEQTVPPAMSIAQPIENTPIISAEAVLPDVLIDQLETTVVPEVSPPVATPTEPTAPEVPRI